MREKCISFPQLSHAPETCAGHLAGVIEMMEAGRPCLDLAQQLHAVEKAIGNAKKELIKDHIHHCMEETSDSLPREFRGADQGIPGRNQIPMNVGGQPMKQTNADDGHSHVFLGTGHEQNERKTWAVIVLCRP